MIPARPALELPAEFRCRLALRVGEVAKLLGISPSGVRSLVRAGKLRAVSSGTGERTHFLVPVTALAAYLGGAEGEVAP